MGETEFSRLKDKRWDIKVSPEAYNKLQEVKALLEEVWPGKRFGMSDVILLMYDWSTPSIGKVRNNREEAKKLTTKKESPSWIH